MEIRGNLGIENGKVQIGKHCTECGEYFIERVTLDDFIPKEDIKDDLCFECLVTTVLLPTTYKYMDNQDKAIAQLKEVIDAQKDVIDAQAEAIKHHDTLISEQKTIIRHQDLEILDLKKELHYG